MTAYEQTDYHPALEVGTLLLTASTAKDFVSYERKGGRHLKYLPYLPPNHSLYPSEAIIQAGPNSVVAMSSCQRMV